MTSPGLLRVHRWAALSLGAFIALVALTGSALVFREELTAAATPAVKVSGQPVAPGAWQRILAAARTVEPGAESLDIVLSLRPQTAAEVTVHRGLTDRVLYVDPHDGAVVADGDREFLPFAAFYQLHRRLLAGEAGEAVVGALGLVLAFLAASGVVLWWPRQWKAAFRVRWSGNRLAVSYDLHRCAGAAFALVLFANAAIGAAMAFDGVSVALVNRLSGSSGPPPAPVATSNALRSGRTLDDIVAAAERALPEGTVRRVSIRPANAPVVVRKRLPTDNVTYGMNRIYVDAASARVLHARVLRELPPGNAMFEWLYPLHTGTLVGTPYRAVLVVAGCIPLFSLATGLILWRTRARRKKEDAHTAAGPRQLA